MVREIRRLVRGKCNNCHGCYGLITLSQRSECDYCGCLPDQHVEIPELEPVPRKRIKIPEDQGSNPDPKYEAMDDAPLDQDGVDDSSDYVDIDVDDGDDLVFERYLTLSPSS